jgi:23S rRNA pseudouridine955/2504/2580 synthase
LLARSSRSAAHFAKAFSSRTARKVYWALIMGAPSIEDGVIELPIAKQPGTGGEKMHVDMENGLPARTRYRVIERAGNRAAWVMLEPRTGRTHQLRVHMAAIGHPIVGDGKYGGKEAFLTGSISRKMHLHARRIRIDHPDGSPLDVIAQPPEHIRESLLSLGFDPEGGDLPLDEELPRESSKSVEKRAAQAHAKDVRKARRGERRGRIGGAASKPGAGKPGAGKPAGKAASGAPSKGKPAGSRAGRPAGSAGPARPRTPTGGGKPGKR